MPRYIVTGCYTQSAVKGMIAKPTDRGAAAAALAEAAGATMEHFFLTTGPNDFMMVISVDDVTDLGAALMVAGAAGAVTNIQTIRAFSSDEFTGMQKKAGTLAKSYSAPT